MQKPISFTKVNISDSFWSPKLKTNHNVTIKASYDQLVKTGRIEALRMNWKPGKPNKPHRFWDSDVAKWVETVAYSLQHSEDPDLEATLHEIVELICAAQQSDGYLNTHFTQVYPDDRWDDLKDGHELYCAGHLMEAAVAYYDATGNDNLLKTMCNYADYIDDVFGLDDGKLKGYPGHEEIELALIKLYQRTGTERYLNLCKFFIDQRGEWPHYFMEEEKRRDIQLPANLFDILKRYTHYQAHLPVREQDEIVGHAVRAGYLWSGVTDLALETDDVELFNACRRVWKDAMLRKMYLTGGVGSSRDGEKFTQAYDLPNEEAYCETCAAISMVFWNHRMLQHRLDSKFADVIERILYNGSISGISLSGNTFFYENPLAITENRRGFKRQDWFSCSCCPNNLSRLLASLGEYIYGVDEDRKRIIVHQFVGGSVETKLQDTNIRLEQSGNYPWDGNLSIKLSLDDVSECSLMIRIPGWCKSYNVTLNGETIEPAVEDGYLNILRRWSDDDEVVLSLDMRIERIHAHPLVTSDLGKTALQRGPIVYCLEEEDNGRGIGQILLSYDAELQYEFRSDLLNGVGVIKGRAVKMELGEWENTLYDDRNLKPSEVEITAIPYYAWANRTPGEMTVWIREC